MLDHISIPVSSLEVSAQFYDGVFEVMGYRRIKVTPLGIGYGNSSDKAPSYWILRQGDKHGAQPGLGLHISFNAATRKIVDFYATAIRLGGSDGGGPGPRPEYTQPFYAAFVFDPDGYKIEATCRG